MSGAAAVTLTEEAPKPRLSVSFRKAAKRDIPALSDIFKRAFEGVNEFGDPTDYLDRARTGDNMRLIVAQDDAGKIGGFVMAAITDWRKTLDIEQLAVDPGFQGKGIGRRLMEQAEVFAKKEGARRLTLHVRVNNDKALHLYESMGYARIGLENSYYQDGTDAFEMAKKLPKPANDNTGWGAVGRFFKKTFGLAP